MSDERKDLPPANSPNFLPRVRETLMVYLGSQGSLLDRGLTLRDLAEVGMIDLSKVYLAGQRGARPVAGLGLRVEDAYEVDLTPPPTPTGFALSAAISNVFIEHAAPTYTQGHGHAKTAVYGATWVSGPLPTFANAVKITEFTGQVFSHPTNPATTWHLWIKWVTKDGVESVVPAGGTNGLAVTTGQDVAKMVTALTGPGNPFKILTAPITLPDGSVAPAGTYTSDAYIHNGQIVNAMIANLAVDNAKIANLAVSKLTAGSIAVGQYIQSTGYVAGSAGWRINGDGNAEFSGVIVRGTVYATAGQIGGNSISASGVSSPNFASGTAGWSLNSDGNAEFNNVTVRGTVYASAGAFSGDISASTGNFRGQVTGGAFTGYAWPAAGLSGFYLGPSGLLLGNANDGKYLQVTAGGDIYSPGFSVIGGVMTVSQANVINTLNIAGEAVTKSVSAFTAAEQQFNGWTTIQTAAITTTGGRLFAMGSARLLDGSSVSGNGDSMYTDSIRSQMRLLRNGVEVTSVIGQALSYSEALGAGTYTYSLQAAGMSAMTFNGRAYNSSLFAIETKR